MSSFIIDIDPIHIVGFSQFHLYEKEILTDEAVVIKSSDSQRIIKYSFGIEVDGSGSTYRGFSKDPYFKIYDGKSIYMSNNITRISIFRPEYIIHDNQKWILSSNERKKLIMLLNHTVKDKTIWQIILEQCVAESNMYDKHMTKEDESKILNAEIPDYTKLQ